MWYKKELPIEINNRGLDKLTAYIGQSYSDMNLVGQYENAVDILINQIIEEKLKRTKQQERVNKRCSRWRGHLVFARSSRQFGPVSRKARKPFERLRGLYFGPVPSIIICRSQGQNTKSLRDPPGPHP